MQQEKYWQVREREKIRAGGRNTYAYTLCTGHAAIVSPEST